MSNATGARAWRRRRTGFTVAELLVAMVIGGVVLAALVRIMMTQGRGYAKQGAILDVRDTERGATSLLTYELRHAAMGGGAPTAIYPDSVTVRSMQALGVVCAKHATLPRIALWRTAGSFAATANDTAYIYNWTTDTWRKVRISATGTPAALGVAACAWAGGRAPDLVVELAPATPTDTSTIMVGAPIRAFRKVLYAEFQQNGQWWLGRRVGAAAAFEQLTGPLLAPGSSGLKFAYYDAAGTVTAVAANVATVKITSSAQSAKQVLSQGSGLAYQVDSIVTKVSLRK